MPTLLLEVGCEELPASACREAEAQLPMLGPKPAGSGGVARLRVAPANRVRRRRAAGDRLRAAGQGPPAERREQAAAGFAKRYGLAERTLEERDGHLWARVPGSRCAGSRCSTVYGIVHGFQFSKSMRWDASGHRFARAVRWYCEKLDAETLAGSGKSFGHRFTHGEVEIASAQEYADTLRAANVEPDAAERRRRIVEALSALGNWQDPLGKLEEVVYMVEWPIVFESEFDQRFLRLPERVIVTAMQSHQRYFPLGENRFAVVAAGGDVDVTRPGYTQVLEARLEDAAFTFDRDVAVGIEELAGGSSGSRSSRAAARSRTRRRGSSSSSGARRRRRRARGRPAGQGGPGLRARARVPRAGRRHRRRVRAAGRSPRVGLPRRRRAAPAGRRRRAAAGDGSRPGARLRTRSTRSRCRSRSATGPRDHGPVRAATGGHRALSAGRRGRAHHPARGARARGRSSSRSGWKAISMSPSSSSALRSTPTGRTSAPSLLTPGSSPSRILRRARGVHACRAHRRRRSRRRAGRRLAAQGAGRAGAGRSRAPSPGRALQHRNCSRVGGRAGARRRDILRGRAGDGPGRACANRLRLLRDVRRAVGRLGDLSQIPL